MKLKLLLTLFAFALATAVNCRAMEISLEENRGESGSVGYVDIERVFKLYPETVRAKEEFMARVREKEKELNVRKEEIYALKADMAALTRAMILGQSGDFEEQGEQAVSSEINEAVLYAATGSSQSLALPVLLPPAPASPVEMLAEISRIDASLPVASSPVNGGGGLVPIISSPAVSSPAGAEIATPVAPPAASGTASVISASPPAPLLPASGAFGVQGFAPPVSLTGVAAEPPSGAVINTSLQVSSSAPALAAGGAAPAGSVAVVEASPAVSTRPAPASPAAVATRPASAEDRLAELKAELEQKEAALIQDQKKAEKELLEYENRKTEIILGRIYKVLKDLSVSENISVVVDKKSILYGQKAVDLTDKLLSRLKRGPVNGRAGQ